MNASLQTNNNYNSKYSNGTSSSSIGYSRNRLSRFEESLNKLNPPGYMNRKDEESTKDQEPRPDTGNFQLHSSNTNSRVGSSRIRYSDYKRSQSAQRNPATYWKKSDYGLSSRPTSREPSPVPMWSRPPTAPAGGRYSRWSASTLSDSVYSGQITPAESVVSCHSNYSRKSVDLDLGNPCLLPMYSSQQKPYLGWRSQENVSEGKPLYGITPNQRLAHSLKKSKMSGSLGSGLAGDSGCSSWRKESYMKEYNSGPADWYIRDSIKSVSCAITEFCQSGVVPKPPISNQEKLTTGRQVNRGRCREKSEIRPRIVWLESSFVSSTNNLNTVAKT